MDKRVAELVNEINKSSADLEWAKEMCDVFGITIERAAEISIEIIDKINKSGNVESLELLRDIKEMYKDKNERSYAVAQYMYLHGISKGYREATAGFVDNMKGMLSAIYAGGN